MKKRVIIQVPATSANLGPGFDVLGVALHWFNEVHVEVGSEGWAGQRSIRSLTVGIQGEGEKSLPRDESNLIVRAAFQVFEKAKRWPKTLRVKLVNRIPLSRGLGSSAAATVGGLCAANALLGKPLSDQALLDIAVAMEGHPDNVVPALFGGLCVASRVDRATRYLRFKVPSGLRAVVCSPEKPLPTAQARRVLPTRVPLAAAVFTASRVAFFLGAMVQKRYDWLGFAMEDVLHQPARAKLIPGLRDVIREARDAGAYGSALSGAGSSVIAFSRPGAMTRRVGQAMQKAFAAHGIKSQWVQVPLENRGVR